MNRFRRARIVIATAWLLCQVSGVIAAPVAFWVTAHDEAMECTCVHGDHVMCPMHHRRSQTAPHVECIMQGTDDTGAAILSTLLGGSATLAPSSEVFLGAPPSEPATIADFTTASLRPAPPEPPPPRA